jgi:hypothetical protein
MLRIVAKRVEAMQSDFLAGVTAHLLKKARRARQSEDAAIRKGQSLGPTLWADASKRILRVPGKELLSAINRELQAAGYDAVAARTLAQRLREGEIDPEIKSLLLQIERGLAH